MEESEHIRSTSEEDRAAESAVLQHVLHLHPSPTTLEDLTRELSGGRDDPDEREAVERAVRDLAAAGLLLLGDSLIMASRAALRFDQLLG